MTLYPSIGAETVENTRKLMALSGKVRPHDPKVPLPTVTSPSLSGKRQQPMSPRHVRPSVRLSAESSSVVSLSNIAHRKPSHTGKNFSAFSCCCLLVMQMTVPVFELLFFFNSILARGDFCRLLMTFANSLDPDQD